MGPEVLAFAQALAAVGTVVEGIGAFGQARAQAKVYKQQAQHTQQVARAEEADLRRKNRALMARQRALLGAAGVDISTGTPLRLAEQTAEEAEYQALRLRSQGVTEATRLRQQAALTRHQGTMALIGGFTRGGAQLFEPYGDYNVRKGARLPRPDSGQREGG